MQEDIDKKIQERREFLDKRTNSKTKYVANEGLTEDLIRKISSDKNEPEWMLKKRLRAFELFKKTKNPEWGPNLKELNLEKIVYYISPDAKETHNWDEVPDEIKETFDKLGIPEAEKKALAGVGAQWDSEAVYHNLEEDLKKQGVIFLNMDEAVRQYPEMIKKYFMTNCVPVSLHKYSMLHAACWSGGTYIYIPKGVKVEMPLQAYFRMNQEKGGQFEHTLIIADEGSEISYIEGCFTKGNLVNTIEGFEAIENIKKNDLVLTDTGKYSKVTSTMKNIYSGNLFEFEIYGDSTQKIICTAEHPILTVKRERINEKNKDWNKKKWLIPQYIDKKDYLCIPRNKVLIENDFRDFEIKKYNRNERKFDKVVKNVKNNKNFFKLIGYYLAEGSISSGSYLNFSFGLHERELIEDVKILMRKVFGIEKFNEFIHKKNNGLNLVFSDVEICRVFKYFGTSCYNKKLPSWVLFESSDKQKELIKGYWLGDGNFYKKRTKAQNFLKEVIRINTVSKNLAYQVREILIRLGVPAFVNSRNREKENRATMYTIGVSGYYLKKMGTFLGLKLDDSINGKKRASMFDVDDSFVYAPIKSKVKREVKNIEIFNFSVDINETYTVANVAVHNCSAPRYENTSLHAGCVELYVMKGAKVKYSSIENWSKNVFNLNTKRANVYENGKIEWLNGNMGCLTESSKIYTKNKGPININNIEIGDEVYSWDEKTNSIKETLVKNQVFSGEKEVFEIKAGGRVLEASANHPFLSLIRKKNKPNHKKAFFHFDWKRLDKLREGDIIGISKKINFKGNSFTLPKINKEIIKSSNQYSSFETSSEHLYNPSITIPKKTSVDFMWLAGLLIGDGFIDVKYNKINIATHITEDYRDKLCKIIEDLFNYEVSYKQERFIVINSKELCRLFKKIGISGKADTKRVPSWIYTLPKEEKLAFLAGYFDADGHVERGGCYYTSVSKGLLEDIKLLAIELGIGVSQVFEHRKAGKMIIVGNECNCLDSWRILFNGKKIKDLPLKCLKKKEKLIKVRTKRNYSTMKGLNFSSKVNDEVGFVKIDSIKSLGIKPTYDIEVEKYENFIANGLIVHNSKTTMLYPASILIGNNSKSESLGVAFASKGQNQDTGTKVIHLGKNTSSVIKSKSVSIKGGICSYRGLVKVHKFAENTKSLVECDSLILDDGSIANAYPQIDVSRDDSITSHEAKIGKISDDEIFYLMSRGLSEERAKQMIVSGFTNEVVKKLPLEYAVELNKLIDMQMEEGK